MPKLRWHEYKADTSFDDRNRDTWTNVTDWHSLKVAWDVLLFKVRYKKDDDHVPWILSLTSTHECIDKKKYMILKRNGTGAWVTDSVTSHKIKWSVSIWYAYQHSFTIYRHYAHCRVERKHMLRFIYSTVVRICHLSLDVAWGWPYSIQ